MPPGPETTPATYVGRIPQSPIVYQLHRCRLGDLPIGALFTRRPPHQLMDELQGESVDLVMGLALRTARALDSVLADSWVWQVTLTELPREEGAP